MRPVALYYHPALPASFIARTEYPTEYWTTNQGCTQLAIRLDTGFALSLTLKRLSPNEERVLLAGFQAACEGA